MRVIHVCLSGPVTDGWNYQENLLTKYQSKDGHNVTIITSRWIWGNDGKLTMDDRDEYIDSEGVHIIRLPMKGKEDFSNKFKKFPSLYDILEKSRPEILFIHGLAYMDFIVLAKYLKKNRNVVAYVDNHGDFSNSGTNLFSKYILQKGMWRFRAQKIVPYVKKFYGVLPARVDFLSDVYKIPKEKCELLVMGADDDLVEVANDPLVREHIRNQFGVKSTDFLVMTGGKINKYRPETLDLMEAISTSCIKNLKLLVFGAVSEDLRERFDELCRSPSIIYAGWVNSAETYGFISASDLMVFPGLHSVMWEQAVAQGKPCVFRKITGYDHVNLGENAEFIEDVTPEGLQKVILEIASDKNKYLRMKQCAQEKGMKFFSYKEIARRSIQ